MRAFGKIFDARAMQGRSVVPMSSFAVVFALLGVARGQLCDANDDAPLAAVKCCARTRLKPTAQPLTSALSSDP